MTQPDHPDGSHKKRRSSHKKMNKRGAECPFAARVRMKKLSRAQDEATGHIRPKEMREINAFGLGCILKNARIGRQAHEQGQAHLIAPRRRSPRHTFRQKYRLKIAVRLVFHQTSS